jgi:Zn-dependent protease with chaperone function
MSLVPTPFHRALRDTLTTQESGLFRWYSSDTYEAERSDRMRLELLRSSYRLSPETYERPHRLAREAAAKLGVEVPLFLYQLHRGEQANAGLCFMPGEAHVVISGPLLASLDDTELVALFGHELAHHLLWTLEDGSFHTVAQLVEASAAHTGAGSAFVEAALRHRRWTEIFADRGSAIAAGAAEPAISCLVKVGTGLGQVSAKDYLEQAREVIARLDDKDDDRGDTHPETAVRAIALHLWQDKGAAAEDEIAHLVDGALRLEALDIVQQRSVADRTRALLDLILAPAWMRTEATLAHARRFFPNYEHASPVTSPPSWPASLADYVAYALLDFAVVDHDLGDVALARALAVASEVGTRDAFAAIARKELKLTAVALAQLEQRATSLFERADQQTEPPT